MRRPDAAHRLTREQHDEPHANNAATARQRSQPLRLAFGGASVPCSRLIAGGFPGMRGREVRKRGDVALGIDPLDRMFRGLRHLGAHDLRYPAIHGDEPDARRSALAATDSSTSFSAPASIAAT